MKIRLAVQSQCASPRRENLDSPNRGPSAVPRRRPRNQGATLPVLVLVLGLALVPCGLVVAALKSYASHVSAGRESRALRASLVKATGTEWRPTVELGVGGGILGLARAGLGFLDLPAEARAVLSAVRGAELGVYRSARGDLDRAGLLNSTDRDMSERGWERVVGVLSGRELVAVYLPSDLRSGRDVRLCVMVLDGEELVVVAARGNLEPLLKLAQSALDRTVSERHGTRF